MKPSYEDLYNGLKVAESYIANAPHSGFCNLEWDPTSIDNGQPAEVFPCDCWKAHALSHIKPLLLGCVLQPVLKEE